VAEQPPLFELSPPPAPGWRPSGLSDGTQVHWTPPAEVESRLDAAFYVIARRSERLLDALACSMTGLEGWAAVNPPERRLPVERGYVLYEQCRYAQVRDIRRGCWLIGPNLKTRSVRDLPQRTVYQPQPGDLLLPRGYASLHKAVVVIQIDLPLVATGAFALLKPHSRVHGLALLALLHHHVLGEQLWAFTSGTTRARAVSASKIPAVQVPQIAPGLRAALAARVEALLHAQAMVTYPGLGMPVAEYWQDGTLSQWRRRAQKLSREVQEMVDQALGVKRKA